MASYNSRTADKFVVRLPDGMREQIADLAREHHRSMNSEIISRLKASMDSGDKVDGDIDEVSTGEAWNPSVGNLVRLNGEPGTITGFSYHKGDFHIQVETESGVKVGLARDVKPLMLRA